MRRLSCCIATALLVVSSLRPGPLPAQEAPRAPGAEPGELGTLGSGAETKASVVPEVLARVDGSKGDYVVWVHDPQQGEVHIGVAATYPNRPLVATEFVTRHNPIEVFLAVAEPDRPVPDELLALHPEGRAAQRLDRGTRLALRQANAVALARWSFSGEGGPVRGPVGCSESFRNWVGDVYGDSSCGNPALNGFSFTSPKDTYCTSGCDNDLGSVDKGECVPALKSCDIVQRTTKNRRQRLADRWGPISITHDGHKAHYGAANCSGNGPVGFSRQRGDSTWFNLINVNGMLHYFQGVWNPAIAATNVTYGSWNVGRDPDGPSYKTNKAWLDNNDGPDDRAILCGDVKILSTMENVSDPFCQGPNISLCNGNNCTSACFHCVGGTCW